MFLQNLSKITPVIMSGGRGTRLYPLSRNSVPKAHLPLFEPTLFSRTLDRLQAFEKILVVTSESLMDITSFEVKKYKTQIIQEPIAKNTAASIILVCLWALEKCPDEYLLFLPSDHHLTLKKSFLTIAQEAVKLLGSRPILLFGVAPSHPSESYGYIVLENPCSGRTCSIKKFVEKPNRNVAEEIIQQNGFWNAGIFLINPSMIKTYFEKWAPETLKAAQQWLTDKDASLFEKIPELNFDRAIVEKIPPEVIGFMELDGVWEDVGTWDRALPLVSSKWVRSPQKVNAGDNTHVITDPHIEKNYIFEGVEDLLLVDARDAILVKKLQSEVACDKVTRKQSIVRSSEAPQEAKAVLEPFYENRPWGFFEVLFAAPHYKVKKITVSPSQKLSYQSHKFRMEQWFVVEGRAEVLLDEKKFTLRSGDHLTIPIGAKHQLINPDRQQQLVVIEIQMGEKVLEKDIHRFSDPHDRSHKVKPLLPTEKNARN